MAAYCLVSYVTCRLTAKNRDQLRNPTLGNRVWAAFTFTSSYGPWWHCFRFFRPTVWRQICCVLVAVGQRHLPAGLPATSSLCFVFLFLFVLLVSRVVNNRAVNWLGARLIAMPNVLDNSYVICKVSAWNMNLSERDDVQCAQFRLILCSLLYHLASVWSQSITVPWTKYSEIECDLNVTEYSICILVSVDVHEHLVWKWNDGGNFNSYHCVFIEGLHYWNFGELFLPIAFFLLGWMVVSMMCCWFLDQRNLLSLFTHIL